VLGGDLVDDLLETHPEGIERIGELVTRGQVELIGTPLHGPVLGAVPERDGADQIRAHTTLIKKVFGVRPSGCWLPLGIWDPCAPRVIARAGMSWCSVEDRFLVDVGSSGQGIWRTEREGHAISLLPTDTEARDIAERAGSAEALQRVLKARSGTGRSHLALAVDLRRVDGSAPSVFGNGGWLSTWVQRLAAGLGEVQTLLPSAAVVSYPQRGFVYLPSSAPRGVEIPWERHLVRHEEANRLHKKMLSVSRQMAGLEREIRDGEQSAIRPDPALLAQARRYLHRAQHPAAYWQGDAAGIYDPVIRSRAWRDLLRAEQVIRIGLKRQDQMSVDCEDRNCDGIEEVVFRTPHLVMVVDPARGAGVTELSWMRIHRNLVDTLTPIREPADRGPTEVHGSDLVDTDAVDDTTDVVPVPSRAEGLRRLEAESGTWPRVSVVERLLGAHINQEDILRACLPDPVARWDLITTERQGKDMLRALFSTTVPAEPGREPGVRLQKAFTVHREARIEVQHEVANRTHEALRTRLAVELNLTLGPHRTDQAILLAGRRLPPSAVGEVQEVSRVVLEAGPHRVKIALRRPAKVTHFPLEAAFRRQGQRVATMQGLCLVLEWPIELWGREREAILWSVELLDAR